MPCVLFSTDQMRGSKVMHCISQAFDDPVSRYCRVNCLVCFILPTNEIRVGILVSAGGWLGGPSDGETLCLKFIPQFLSHPNETCYT